jgi:hypothetical protein
VRLPEVLALDRLSRPASKRNRSTRWPGLTATALLAGVTAGCGYVHASAVSPAGIGASVAASGTSSAPPPKPEVMATAKIPAPRSTPRHTSAGSSANDAPASGSGSGSSPQDYAGSLVLDEAGSALTSWNQTASYCPTTTGMLANGTVGTDSSGDATLTTPGKAGSCVALISPGTYSSDVIEADVDFPALPGKPGTIANWVSVWLTNGPAWPEDGELDGAEIEPVNAENAVTWHSGTTTDLFSASTSGFAPIQLPVDGPNLSPGWHTVDIVYTKGFFAVYYDGEKYSSYTSSNIPGSPLNLYFTMGDTPATASIEQSIGGAPINSASSPVTMSVKYLKIWSYR